MVGVEGFERCDRPVKTTMRKVRSFCLIVKSLWDDWDLPSEKIGAVAEKFVKANEFPPHPK